MKINFLLRLKNKTTLVALLATLFALATQLGLKLPENIQEIANTVVTLLMLLGIVVDPTTHGIGDSEQALNYEEPHKD